MKILITGASGKLGAFIIRAWHSDGETGWEADCYGDCQVTNASSNSLVVSLSNVGRHTFGFTVNLGG